MWNEVLGLFAAHRITGFKVVFIVVLYAQDEFQNTARCTIYNGRFELFLAERERLHLMNKRRVSRTYTMGSETRLVDHQPLCAKMHTATCRQIHAEPLTIEKLPELHQLSSKAPVDINVSRAAQYDLLAPGLDLLQMFQSFGFLCWSI